MPGLLDSLSQRVQRLLVRWLIHKGLEELLMERLDLNQIETSLRDGTFRLRNLELDPWELNKRLGKQSFYVTEGRIGELSGRIPFQNLREGNSQVHVTGLYLEIWPIDDVDEDLLATPFPDESQPPSRSASGQNYGLRAPEGSPEEQGIEDDLEEFLRKMGPREQGLTTLTYMIRTIVANLKAQVSDMKIMLCNRKPYRGVHRTALSVHVASVEYADVTSHHAQSEAGVEGQAGPSPNLGAQAAQSAVGQLQEAFDAAISPTTERQIKLTGLSMLLRIWKTANDTTYKDVEIASDGTQPHLISVKQNHLRRDQDQPKLEISVFLKTLQMMINPEIRHHVEYLLLRCFGIDSADNASTGESSKASQASSTASQAKSHVQSHEAKAPPEQSPSEDKGSSMVKFDLQIASAHLSLAFDHVSWTSAAFNAAEFFSHICASPEDHANIKACPVDHLALSLGNIRFSRLISDTQPAEPLDFFIHRVQAHECAWWHDGERHRGQVYEVLRMAPAVVDIEAAEKSLHGLPRAQTLSQQAGRVAGVAADSDAAALRLSIDMTRPATEVTFDFQPCVATLDVTILDRLYSYVKDPLLVSRARSSSDSQDKSSAQPESGSGSSRNGQDASSTAPSSDAPSSSRKRRQQSGYTPVPELKIHFRSRFARLFMPIGPPPKVYRAKSFFSLGRIGKPRLSAEMPCADLEDMTFTMTIMKTCPPLADHIHVTTEGNSSSTHPLDEMTVDLTFKRGLLSLYRPSTGPQSLVLVRGGDDETEQAGPATLRVGIRSSPPAGSKPSRLFRFNPETIFLPVKHQLPGESVTYTCSLDEKAHSRMQQNCWRLADIVVNFDAQYVLAHLPKASLDRLYQLVMDLSEWAPWAPAWKDIQAYVADLSAPEFHAEQANRSGKAESAKHAPSLGDSTGKQIDDDEDEDEVMQTPIGTFVSSADADESDMSEPSHAQPSREDHNSSGDGCSVSTDAESADSGEGWESDDIEFSETESDAVSQMLAESMSSAIDDDEDEDESSYMFRSQHPLAAGHLSMTGSELIRRRFKLRGGKLRRLEPCEPTEEEKPSLRHDTVVVVNFASALLYLEERVPGVSDASDESAPPVPDKPGTFEVCADDLLLFVTMGYNRTKQRVISMRANDMTVDELVSPESLAGYLYQYRAEATTTDTGLVRLPVARPVSFSSCAPPSNRRFRMAMLMDVNQTMRMQTTTIALDFAHLKLYHRFQERGMWLMRFVDILDLPDSEWTKQLAAEKQVKLASLLRLNVNFSKTYAVYLPLCVKQQLLLSFAEAHITSNMSSKSDRTVLSFHVHDLEALMVPGRDWLMNAVTVDEHLQAGWQSLIRVGYLNLLLRLCSDDSRPDLDLTITDDNCRVAVCADSLRLLHELMDGIIQSKDEQIEKDALEHLRLMLQTHEGDPSAEAFTAQPDSPGASGVDRSSSSSGPPQRTSSRRSPPPPIDVKQLTPSQVQARTGFPEPFVVSRNNSDASERSDDDVFASALGGDSQSSSASHSPTRSRASSDGTTPTASRSHSSDADSMAFGQPYRLTSSGVPRPRPLDSSSAFQDDLSEVLRTPTLTPTQEIGDGASLSEQLLPETDLGASSLASQAPLQESTSDGQAPLVLDLDVDENYFNVSRVDVFGRPQVADSSAEEGRPSTPSSSSILDFNLSEREKEATTLLLADAIDGADDASLEDAGDLMNSYSAPDIEASEQVQVPFKVDKTPTFTVNRMSDQVLRIVEDFFERPTRNDVEDELSSDTMPDPKQRFYLKNVNVTVRLHGGLDFGDADGIGAGRSPRMAGSDRGPATLSGRNERASSTDNCSVLLGPGRRDDEFVEIVVHRLSVSHETYSKQQKYASRLIVAIKDVTVLDAIPQSYVKKMLGDFSSKDMPRESNSTFFRMEMLDVRTPGMGDRGLETLLSLHVLPLRLSLDQDTLDFVVAFGLAFAGENTESNAGNEVPSRPANTGPVPGQAAGNNTTDESHADGDVSENQASSSASSQSLSGEEAPSSSSYFRRVVIGPIFVRVDYEPKHVSFSDLIHGDLSQLMGIMPLRNAVVAFDGVTLRGLNGWPHLIQALAVQYQRDIMEKNIPSLVVAGVPGAGSVMAVVRAGANMFQQPVRQYPRVLQGVRDGVTGGVHTTAVEICNVGTTLSFAVQTALERAHGLVGESMERRWSRLASQPANFSDGMRLAWGSLRQGVAQSYSDLVLNPRQQAGESSGQLWLRTLTAVPSAGMRPMIALCEAASMALQGMRNSLNPELHRELSERYKPGSSYQGFSSA